MTPVESPRKLSSYDQFLGSFVDAVQSASTDYQELHRDWSAACPLEWLKRFQEDTAEIEDLIAAGVF